MRNIQLWIIGVLVAVSLTGCMNKTSSCFPGQRCEEYQVYTRCGSYLRYECEEICKTCNAYEPSCYSCYACIESSPQSCQGAQLGKGQLGYSQCLATKK